MGEIIKGLCWPIKGILLLLALLSGTGCGVDAGYSYGPACQWIRLRGEIQGPSGKNIPPPYQLSVYYQLPNQKNPAVLFHSHPLTKNSFVFVLSGFKEKIEGVHFVSPGFLFAKEIKFTYFAQTADGSWSSKTRETIFHPPHVPRISIPKNAGKNYLCNTGIQLDPLVLQKG